MAEQPAEEAKAEAASEANATDGGKSKKKIIIIALAALLLIAVGGGAAAFFLLGSSSPSTSTPALAEGSADDSPEEAENASAKPKDPEKGPGGATAANDAQPKQDQAASADKDPAVSGIKFGNTFTFKTFHLNLGNPLENHYIRLEIAVEYKGGEDHRKEIEQRLPQLRDAVVSVASRKTREFLLGPDGKDQLRREILIRMNRYMSQPLESVFLTDILIE